MAPEVKDWSAHKKACKDAQNTNLEKKLARVAEIVQQAYYKFRENTWDTPVIRIEDRDDALLIYDDVMLNKKKYFIDFPHHLVTNDRSKKAILCAWACNEPMAWLHDTLVGLLEGNASFQSILGSHADLIISGLNTKVEEVAVSLGAVSRKITFHDPFGNSDSNWPKFHHDVVHITANKTKMQWIMDLSGVQYGIHRAFWRWKEYEHEHLAKTKDVQATGTNKARLKILAKIPGNPSLNYGLVGLVADHLDEMVRKWNTDNGLSLAVLLDLSKETYKQAISKLLQATDVAVRVYINTHDFKAEFKAAQSYERRHPGASGKMACKVSDLFFPQPAPASNYIHIAI
ncbi:hypothetical protein J4E91_005785 [Alternaria rosae]|nr:hypothetical protein J4E91_005785 [Alternaria rosae]